MFDLHLPVGTKDAYADRIKDIPEDKRASWRFHVVRSGETLDGIALALHGRPTEIATVNGIDAGRSVATDDELVIPVATAASSPKTQHYTVRRGDTLVTIADRYNVTVEELRSWNHLRSSTVTAGRTLNITAPVKLGPVTRVRAKRARVAARSASNKNAAAKNVKTKSGSAKKAAVKVVAPKKKSKGKR